MCARTTEYLPYGLLFTQSTPRVMTRANCMEMKGMTKNDRNSSGRIGRGGDETFDGTADVAAIGRLGDKVAAGISVILHRSAFFSQVV